MSESIWIPESFLNRPHARRHFAAIVDWASQHHPFYRRHIAHPDRGVPILHRAHAQAENELLLNGHAPTGHTSGSTGFPLQIAWSPEKTMQQRQVNQRFQNLMGGPLPRVRLIGMLPDHVAPDAMLVGSPLDEQLAFIEAHRRERGIRAIVTYPTNAVNLARAICDQHADYSYIERIVCFSEAIDDNDREQIQAAFPNARIWSTYSSKEVGMIAFQCPHDSRYHHTDAVHLGVEVLDPDDQPCAPGTPGRAILTDYLNPFSPFIRYDIGDYVEAGECPCGQFPGLALRRVIGKQRGALKRANGEPVMFASIAARLRDVPGLLQYQVIQESLTTLTVRYVVASEADEAQVQHRCRHELIEFLGFEPVMQFVRESRIDREPSGKFHASICRV